MDNYRIIIRPKGLIALTALVSAAMIGITTPQWIARRQAAAQAGASEKKPVGQKTAGVGTAPTAAAGAADSGKSQR